MEKPFVLVADDNAATCTLITALLRRDFNVEIAVNGMEAIARLKSRQYAVILLDLLMPMGDGYSVLDFIRAEQPDNLRRVLVVTASLAQREMQRVSGYEICRVLAKPFEVDVLASEVRRCAGGQHEHGLPASLIATGILLLLAAAGT